MILLNFWDKEELKNGFRELYNLSESELMSILDCARNDEEENYVCDFCENTGVFLDELDVSHNVELFGKIVSTTTDDNKSLQQYGVRNLDDLLEQDTPISRHLLNYGIRVNVKRQELFIGKRRFELLKRGEKCRECIFGKDKCMFEHRESFCPYIKDISLLCNKLYADNSEIEMFLIASENEMLEYSTVKNFPEIFDTIEQLAEKLTKKHFSICQDWMNQKNSSFFMSFKVLYDDLSYKTDYLCGGNLDSEIEIDKYKKFIRNDYFDSNMVPKCVWDNIWVIKKCIYILLESDGYTPTIYAGIKHGINIPYDNLTIENI